MISISLRSNHCGSSLNLKIVNEVNKARLGKVRVSCFFDGLKPGVLNLSFCLDLWHNILRTFPGVTNTVGRVSAGALANVSGVNILHLNNISLVITGVATALCGALCRNFTHLAIYAAVFGFFVGGYRFCVRLCKFITVIFSTTISSMFICIDMPRGGTTNSWSEEPRIQILLARWRASFF